MRNNICPKERIVRLLAGIALLAFCLLYDEPLGAFGWLGILPLVTALVGFCPLYALFGIENTDRCH